MNLGDILPRWGVMVCRNSAPGDSKTESQAENWGGFQGDKLMMKRDEAQYEKDVTFGIFWVLKKS